MRMLDADAEDEVARIVLHIDPEREPDRGGAGLREPSRPREMDDERIPIPASTRLVSFRDRSGVSTTRANCQSYSGRVLIETQMSASGCESNLLLDQSTTGFDPSATFGHISSRARRRRCPVVNT